MHIFSFWPRIIYFYYYFYYYYYHSDINYVSDWCAANSMKLNIIETRVVSYTRKTNFLNYEHPFCHATITRTSSIKDLGGFFDSKLHFHSHVDYLLSECMKLLWSLCSILYRFSSLGCQYFTLVRSRLEYASVVWNSITSTDANKLERIQQKFSSVCFYFFFPACSINLHFCLFLWGGT
jgi:hypothetical protein